jgi:hypothetical protein
MQGLCTCTLHNSETPEPLTWIRVRPSHRYACTLSLSLSLVHTCFVLCLMNISKYTTFKPITRLVLSYINLATYHTLFSLTILKTSSLKVTQINSARYQLTFCCFPTMNVSFNYTINEEKKIVKYFYFYIHVVF